MLPCTIQSLKRCGATVCVFLVWNVALWFLRPLSSYCASLSRHLPPSPLLRPHTQTRALPLPHIWPSQDVELSNKAGALKPESKKKDQFSVYHRDKARGRGRAFVCCQHLSPEVRAEPAHACAHKAIPRWRRDSALRHRPPLLVLPSCSVQIQRVLP